ncbi:MAG: type II secretion system protein [Cyanobacteria bacterium]|nr:type II secretion system protein [Cyanobacteriota bacterium]MDA0867184.1 type II secretion system protein [Cyanobacteriota bacterium]
MKRLRSAHNAATAGFTLLEVLVVMIIAGVLAGIAAPDWFTYLNNRRVTTVRDEVRQVLEEAQNRARSERQSQTVTVNVSDPLPTLSISSTASTASAGDQRVLGGDGIRENMVALSTPGSTTLTFDYQGLVDDSTALPFIIEVAPGNVGGKKRCVIVATILGSITTREDNECDTFTP